MYFVGQRKGKSWREKDDMRTREREIVGVNVDVDEVGFSKEGKRGF